MKKISLRVKKEKDDLVAEVILYVPDDFTLKANLWSEEGYTVDLENPHS